MTRPKASYRALARLDARLNRIYGSRWNPLYHSGAITVALLGVLLVTGIYLLVFYRIGAPWVSVERLNGQVWTGRWIRALHRFASDAAVVAAVVHAFRMYAQRRTWGPRALAWVSGIVLLGVIFVSGWTGYVLVWDEHAQLLAVEMARILDALPIFSEPLSRSFTGDQRPPNAFFFVQLFVHIALPLTIGLLLWVHVARLARPVLLPARGVMWGSVAALTAVAVLWPLPMIAEADLLRIPRDVPVDLFFGFWMPLTWRLPPWAVWVVGTGALTACVAVPWLTRPRRDRLPAPAVVDERTCTGCEQCVRDCPWDAIRMVARTDGREGMVARVSTELCTSCGICVGSCPPMSIGPGATGRDQLVSVRAFLEREAPGDRDVVFVGCTWSAAAAEAERHGASFFPVPCVGAMHTSTVEFLLRGGAGGVLVVGCAEHDGRTREGVTWTAPRLAGVRRADLKERVDRRRLRLVEASLGEHAQLHEAALAFSDEIEALANAAENEDAVDLVSLCRTRSDGTESGDAE